MSDTESPPVIQPETNTGNTFIVGIGSSAGGLETLIPLVKALPKNLNCSIVIIQHLSPNYRSMMVELLARETQMSVCEAEDGVKPRLGHIYIAPPKWDIVLDNGHFSLLEPASTITAKPSVNRFLHSLASQKEEFAISVILSGTGTDGAAGSRSIKANGGITFAQNPQTAKYSGMPAAAVAEGVIDRILEPTEIAEDIVQLVTLGATAAISEENQTEDEMLQRLFKLIRRQTKIDFSGYKLKTVWRRIHRRMAANRISHFDQYLEFAIDNPAELETLGKHILISVTAFFRDPEVFVLLRSELKKVFKQKSTGDEIRIWVPGCATGEEAYTIAIIVDQLLGAEANQFSIQIFATDIDMAAIEVARRGIYPSTALEGLPEDVIRQYFTPSGANFSIAKKLRDYVVFARQDLVLDPPFLRLDLVSCRNLLIYFDNTLQKRVLEIINYALLDGALLLLGRSESITQQESMFLVKNSRLKLFASIAKKHGREITNRRFPSGAMAEISTQPSPGLPPVRSNYEDVFQDIVERYFIPPSVLIDSEGRVLNIQGDVSPFIRFADGRPNLSITKLLDNALTSEYIAMAQTAVNRNKLVRGHRRRFKPGPDGMMQMLVCPFIDSDNGQRLHLLAFSPVQVLRKTSRSNDANVRELENELTYTREHMQTLTEELETSNEELQALNEEIQASNEELQASNEELEASNEELQATNEELVTLNQEMIVKTSEMSALNADFIAVQNSLDFPMLILDANNQVTRLNQAANDLLGNQIPPRGNAFEMLHFDGDETLGLETIQEVTNRNTQVVRDITFKEREYQLHVKPVLNAIGQQQGAIISLLDQHELITSEKEAQRNRNFLMAVMNNSITHITVKDLSGRYRFANRAFLDFFSLDEIEDKLDSNLLPAEIASVFRRREVAVLENQMPHLSEDHFSWNGHECMMESISFPIVDEEGIVYAVCTQSRDITLEKRSRDQLRLAAKVFDRAAEGIMVTDAEKHILSVNHAFTRVTGFTQDDVEGKKPEILSSGKHDPKFYEKMWTSISELGWWQGEIWNRRKNGETYPEWLTISRVTDDNGDVVNYLAIFSDISNLKDSQLKAEYMASHDELTGLANRMLFKDRLKHALQRVSRSDANLYILFCDLDNFKNINDTLGHDIGDQLLQQVADRLLKSVREGDTVARLGGDEFIILIEETDITTVEQVCIRILDYLSASFRIKSQVLNISCSIGISQYPDDGQDSDSLIKNADLALYRSKETGKNTYTFFSGELRYQSQKLLAVQIALRLSLQNDEFSLAFQPVLQNNGSTLFLEALLRWESSDFRHMKIRDVIDIAEQSGIMQELDEWVIKRAAASIRDCNQRGIVLPPLAINLSAGFFTRNDNLERLQATLAEHAIDCNSLLLEFSEKNMQSSNPQLVSSLQSFRDAGFTLILDDFGSNASSITLLRKLPVSLLKIDTSLIKHMTDHDNDRQLVEAIIKLGQAFNLQVIAEGVENSVQREVLEKLNCPGMQGNHFHPPAELNEFVEMEPHDEK